MSNARERLASTAALQARIVELTRERDEARQQQAATADVLKIISRSVFNLPSVLDTLIESAVRLCAADSGGINRREGDIYVTLATHGYSSEHKAHFAAHPLPAGRGSVTGRAEFEGKPVHVPDVLADPEYRASNFQQAGDYRTVLAVPLLRDGKAIGVFALARAEVKAFTQAQIDLVTTFADQAVIAIENVRLFDEVQARTRDLSEALQQQTATANVLKVISRSAFDLDAVFATLTTSAAELIGATMGTIAVRDGDVLRYRAFCGLAPELTAWLTAHPVKPGRQAAVARVFLSGDVVRIPDVLEDPEYAVPTRQYRSILAVPLLRNETVEGVFSIARAEPGDFTPRQIEVLQTFADQAVIAIENARLFNEVQARTGELSEALQQQTATADVLKVISRSAFDLQNVLDTLVDSAARLCAVDKGSIMRRDGDVYRWLATHGYSDELKLYFAAHPLPAGRGSVSGRAGLEGRAVHVPDVLADPEYAAADAQRAAGYRTALGVPLMRDGTAIGVLRSCATR